jgi:hypothetical protein
VYVCVCVCADVAGATISCDPFYLPDKRQETKDKRKTQKKIVPEEPQRNNQRKTEENKRKQKKIEEKERSMAMTMKEKNPRNKDQSQLQERRAEPTSTCTLYKPPKKKINPENNKESTLTTSHSFTACLFICFRGSVTASVSVLWSVLV